VKFVGIDIASQTHVVAVVDEARKVLVRPTSFGEDAAGHEKLFELLGPPDGALVALEATGHYWRNLVSDLLGRGFAVALINPLRTRRHAEEDLKRTKTDAIDALGIAFFAQEKRPAPTRLPDSATEELKELVRLRDRFVRDFGDRVLQLHRLVDLGFPEFTRFVKTLDSELATAVLHEHPTAQAFVGVSVKRLAKLCYDGRHKVGRELAHDLVRAAESSVGRHHGEVYRTQVRFACEDLDVLRRRIRSLSDQIEETLDRHEVGKLLTSIEGIGAQTAARLVAELGDIAQFRDAGAIASYIGIVPGLKLSGMKTGKRAGIVGVGNVRLRTALWMPVLTAVRKCPWLRAFYERLVARGKLPKVALIAAMRKLLVAIHWIARHKQPFVARLASQEVLA
jgi:transposase